MTQRRDRASLLSESPGVLSLEPLNRDDTIQARIPRLPHFSHATHTDGREDFAGAEFVACFERHIF
jgi:hypothetical protein